MKNKTAIVFFCILIAILIINIIWAFHIVPMQMDFTDKCVRICIDKNMSSEVSFNSLPWSNLNGKCYCKQSFLQGDKGDKI